MEKGMTLLHALKSKRKLYKFFLKILRLRRNGGVLSYLCIGPHSFHWLESPYSFLLTVLLLPKLSTQCLVGQGTTSRYQRMTTKSLFFGIFEIKLNSMSFFIWYLGTKDELPLFWNLGGPFCGGGLSAFWLGGTMVFRGENMFNGPLFWFLKKWTPLYWKAWVSYTSSSSSFSSCLRKGDSS